MTETVRLIAFPGAPNLPIFAARENGFFEDRGIDLELTTTPNSVYQIEKLAAGDFDLAATAFDNIVAYQEGQGAVSLEGDPDLFVFMGATQIELSLVVTPDIASFDGLKGRSLALDALATGFAFVLYRMLENAGLTLDDVTMIPVGATPDRWKSVEDGSHAGTLTIEPFTAMARGKGFGVLESSLETVDHYQGGIFAAKRGWAGENADLLKGFIAAYLDGLAWVLDPANLDPATEILTRNMPAIKPAAASKVMAKVLSPETGLTPLAAINPDGMATVLELRSAYGPAGTDLHDADKYLDLSFYRDALRT